MATEQTNQAQSGDAGAADDLASDSYGVAGVVEGLVGEVGELPGVGGLGPGYEGGGAAEPAIPIAGAHPTEAPPVSLRLAALYSSGNFGSGVFYGFNNFILSIFLLNLNVPILLNGLLSSTRSFEGAIIQPLVGSWSDRSWHQRFGRRNIFVVWFAPVCVAFVLATPFLTQLVGLGLPFGLTPGITAIILATVGIFLFTLTFNVMYDPYQALLADITPERQRGGVNGLFQALGASGQVIILVLAIVLAGLNHNKAPLTVLFILTGALLAFGFLPTLLGVREPRNLPGVSQHRRYTWRDYWDGLRSDPQVGLYFATQFFLWFGINAITPNLTYYAEKSLHFDDTQALILSFILLLTSALFVWPFGLLGDRIGLKRTFLLGMILMAGAAIAAVFIKQVAPLYVVLALAGVGNAAQTASSYPLLTRVTLPDRMGLYTGLNSTVTSIAAPGGALLASTLITVYGYSVFFPFVAAMFLASLIPLALFHVERSVAARTLRGELAVG
ncbi:MAG TPA: MFS transporter [Ktedonobacterales bacterium]|nr:MFS transporter [Ktedonobacterales bacterium]